jgi:hypothetical protein
MPFVTGIKNRVKNEELSGLFMILIFNWMTSIEIFVNFALQTGSSL